MNRQIELSELISKSFIESTNKMSQDDKLAFYQAILDGNKNIEREILKKYNYTVVTPVENIMSDEDAEALANSLLKDEKGLFNEINNLFVSASKKYWSNADFSSGKETLNLSFTRFWIYSKYSSLLWKASM